MNKQTCCDVTTESWNDGHRKGIYYPATAGKHVSTAAKTRCHVSNTLAIASQQSTSHVEKQWKNTWNRYFVCDPCRCYIERTSGMSHCYEIRNTRNGTHIITKETQGFSAMKSYLKKNNLHCFTFSPNSEKPFKAVIRHLPPDTPSKRFPAALRT
jgi:hypothetical protein